MPSPPLPGDETVHCLTVPRNSLHSIPSRSQTTHCNSIAERATPTHANPLRAAPPRGHAHVVALPRRMQFMPMHAIKSNIDAWGLAAIRFPGARSARQRIAQPAIARIEFIRSALRWNAPH